VTPVPVPVVVVGPPPAIAPAPNLSAAATTTVTVVPEPDVGDGVASTGETHGGQRGEKEGSNPDLTAVPPGPDAAGDSEIRPESNDGDDGDDGNVTNPDGNDEAHPQRPGEDPDHGEKHG
jgi:hypothetical protein